MHIRLTWHGTDGTLTLTEQENPEYTEGGTTGSMLAAGNFRVVFEKKGDGEITVR